MKKITLFLAAMFAIGSIAMTGCTEKDKTEEPAHVIDDHGGDNGGGNGGENGGNNNDPVNENAGMLSGLFSVSDNLKVHFSQGNLQYTITGTHLCADGTTQPGTWRFAENQYDFIGEDNANTSPSYDGWIDLFGWATSGYHDANDEGNVNYMPYSTAYEELDENNHFDGYGPSPDVVPQDITGDSRYYDWGVYNAISNGGNAPGRWRTLTLDEWRYLFRWRECDTLGDTINARFCKANVCGVNGAILFPDVYEHPASVAIPQNINIPNVLATFADNTYDADAWNAMQRAGAVFLPSAWQRKEGVHFFPGYEDGHYWSSTHNETGSANAYVIGASVISSYGNTCSDGNSVRLVRSE